MDWISWTSAVVYGLLTGVFVNYLADILPGRRHLEAPRYLSCGEVLNRVGYYLWPKRCYNCGHIGSGRVWLVNICLVLLSLQLSVDNPLPLSYWTTLILVVYLVLVTVIDMEHRLIPFVSSIFGMLLSLGIGIRLYGFGTALVGGLVGFGIMLGLYLLGIGFVRFSQRYRKRYLMEQDAIGFGDVIFGSITGFLLGWPAVITGILYAVLIGGLVSLLVLIWHAERGSYHPALVIPYSPFLTSSVFILLFLRFWLSI